MADYSSTSTRNEDWSLIEFNGVEIQDKIENISLFLIINW